MSLKLYNKLKRNKKYFTRIFCCLHPGLWRPTPGDVNYSNDKIVNKNIESISIYFLMHNKNYTRGIIKIIRE